MLNTYQATIDYLYQQLPMFQRVGKKAFKKDLRNIRQLCTLLQMPHQQYPTIHIAGTNGKGSTAHGIAAILQASGLKVGLYTSPHYRDFRERIKINGAFISEAAVIDFVNTYKDQFSAIQPSFFEITVALAFHHFAQEKVDIAVIETGLGGILDSTNIISPILSIITNISYDHMNILGKTLPKIASSKAGIIKPNVPVVMGEWQEETHTVFREKAKETNSALFFADQILSVKKTGYALTHLTLDVYKNGHPHYLQLQSDLKGIYQNKNLLTILQSVEVLQNLNIGYDFTETMIREGLANVTELCRFMGRWQILSEKEEKPVVVADSAHNPAGLQEVIQHLELLDFRQLHIVLGVVKGKDISKALAFFPKDAQYYFCSPNTPRGLDATILHETAVELGLQGEIYNSVELALQAAKNHAQENDFIYVGGSTFVVAEVI